MITPSYYLSVTVMHCRFLDPFSDCSKASTVHVFSSFLMNCIAGSFSSLMEPVCIIIKAVFWMVEF